MSCITTSDGVAIRFTQWGDPDGEAVLFIHGLGADNIGWVRQRQAFFGVPLHRGRQSRLGW